MRFSPSEGSVATKTRAGSIHSTRHPRKPGLPGQKNARRVVKSLNDPAMLALGTHFDGSLPSADTKKAGQQLRRLIAAMRKRVVLGETSRPQDTPSFETARFFHDQVMHLKEEILPGLFRQKARD